MIYGPNSSQYNAVCTMCYCQWLQDTRASIRIMTTFRIEINRHRCGPRIYISTNDMVGVVYIVLTKMTIQNVRAASRCSKDLAHRTCRHCPQSHSLIYAIHWIHYNLCTALKCRQIDWDRNDASAVVFFARRYSTRPFVRPIANMQPFLLLVSVGVGGVGNWKCCCMLRHT